MNDNASDRAQAGEGLSPRLRAEITRALCSVKPVKRIILFGSRARGSAQRTSDVDLAVDDEAWTDRDINLAHDRLEEEIPTALTFDLVNLGTVTNQELQEAITTGGKIIYES